VAISVQPLTPAIGAEIHGVDLNGDLGRSVIEAIRRR
jgi:alpha-ketoglutarate-dependent taurine dioxygenase